MRVNNSSHYNRKKLVQYYDISDHQSYTFKLILQLSEVNLYRTAILILSHVKQIYLIKNQPQIMGNNCFT